MRLPGRRGHGASAVGAAGAQAGAAERLCGEVLDALLRRGGLPRQAAGLEQFTDGRAADPALRALAAKVSYEIDPNDEYPRNFTGTLIATLKDGRVREFRQRHMRGGAREPLTDEQLSAKFLANAAFGGMAADEARRLEAALLAPLRQAAS